MAFTPTRPRRTPSAWLAIASSLCWMLTSSCGGASAPSTSPADQSTCMPRPATIVSSATLAKEVETVCAQVASTGVRLRLFVGNNVARAAGPPQCPSRPTAVLETASAATIQLDGYLQIAFYPTRAEQLRCYQIWRAWALRYSHALTTAGSDEAEGAPIGAVDIYVRASTVPPLRPSPSNIPQPSKRDLAGIVPNIWPMGEPTTPSSV